MTQNKRVVVISDMHCGHKLGLTHEDFDARPNNTASRDYKAWLVRRKCRRWYVKKTEELKPVHLVIVNGDAVDGKGTKSGGTEQLTTDRTEQVDMAAALIQMWDAKNIVMSHGTSYHVGRDEDWEDHIFKHRWLEDRMRKIGGHDTVSINGVVFDYKHHIGKSSIPHGRFTALAREHLWNQLWSLRGEYPEATILLRSHVHYHVYCGDTDWLAVITPALQAYGSKFGARIPSGTVDYGLLHFDITDKGEWSWQSHILRFKEARRAHLLEL